MGALVLYLVMKCDEIKNLFNDFLRIVKVLGTSAMWIWVITGFVYGLVFLHWGTCPTHKAPVFMPDFVAKIISISSIVAIVAVVLLLILGILRRLVPSTKEMAVLLVVPPLTSAIANNESLKRIPKKMISLAEEWIDTLKPKSNKKE